MNINQPFNNALFSVVKQKTHVIKLSLMLIFALIFSSNGLQAQSCGTVNVTKTVPLGGNLVITVTGAVQYSGPPSLFVIINGSGAGIYNCPSATNTCDFNIVIPQSSIGGVGTYSIQTTQSPGAMTCLNTTFCIVDPNNPPKIDSIAAANETCPNANDGKLLINASGGSGGYQYSINNGASYSSSNIFNNLSPGNYSVKVKDNCGVESSTVPAPEILPGIDTTPPTITCPGTQTVSANTNCQASLPNYTSLATASDNCDTSLTITQSPAAGTTISGTQTVTLKATDDAGNMQQCTFNVTVVDNTAPTVNCPADITVNNDLGQCGAVVNFSPTATDNHHMFQAQYSQ